MSVKTYDPSQVSVIIGGSIIKSWEKIMVEYDEDEWNFGTGTSGETTRVKNASKFGTITVTLPQGSTDNDTLAAFALAGSLLACLIKDNSGSAIASMPEGTIAKRGNIELDSEAVDKEWPIKGDFAIMLPGGNL